MADGSGENGKFRETELPQARMAFLVLSNTPEAGGCRRWVRAGWMGRHDTRRHFCGG